MRFWHLRCPMAIFIAMSDVTQILFANRPGRPTSGGRIAAPRLQRAPQARRRQNGPRKTRAGDTLQATALVHEALSRRVRKGLGIRAPGSRGASSDSFPPAPSPEPQAPSFHSRGHFFAAAAEAMRRILVETARRKRANEARRRALRRVDFEQVIAAPSTPTSCSPSMKRSTASGKGRPPGGRVGQAPLLRRPAPFRQAAAPTGHLAADRQTSVWTYARAWLQPNCAAILTKQLRQIRVPR